MSRLHIRQSGIAGRGVFAGEDIAKGKVLFIMKGRIVRFHASTKRESMLNPNRVGIRKDIWMEPDMKLVRYINHSCDPNAGIKGSVTFIALRDIKEGEEITFDYSISEDSKWELQCSCGSKKCRGRIGGIRTLPEDIFCSYLPLIPRYFQSIYRQSHPNFHCSEKHVREFLK